MLWLVVCRVSTYLWAKGLMSLFSKKGFEAIRQISIICEAASVKVSVGLILDSATGEVVKFLNEAQPDRAPITIKPFENSLTLIRKVHSSFWC